MCVASCDSCSSNVCCEVSIELIELNHYRPAVRVHTSRRQRFEKTVNSRVKKKKIRKEDSMLALSAAAILRTLRIDLRHNLL